MFKKKENEVYNLSMRDAIPQPEPEKSRLEPLYTEVKNYAKFNRISVENAYKEMRKQLLIEAVYKNINDSTLKEVLEALILSL
jgi:hypothetical protein